jgi:AmpE protein
MKLLILVAVWALHRGVRLSLSSSFDDSAVRLFRGLSGTQLAQWLGVQALTLLTILLPVVLLWLLMARLGAWYYGAISGFLSFMILAMLLGCNRLRLATEAYQGDERRNRWPDSKNTLLAAGLLVKRNWISVDARHKDVCSQILALNIQRYFVVVFWFMVAGPAGALLARLTQAARTSRGQDSAVVALARLTEWLPGRLFMLTSALFGHQAALFRTTSRGSLFWVAELQGLSLALVQSLYVEAGKKPGGHSANPLALQVRNLLSKVLLLWLAMLCVGLLAVGVF